MPIVTQANCPAWNEIAGVMADLQHVPHDLAGHVGFAGGVQRAAGLHESRLLRDGEPGRAHGHGGHGRTFLRSRAAADQER